MGETTINFDLSKVTSKINEGLARSIRQCGLHCVRVAKSYAPRSPTMKQMKADKQQRQRGKKRKATVARRKRVSHGTKASPGGLEKSILCDILRDTAVIYVAANSPAGKYARRIHDGKGKWWFERGAGTRAKGDKADEKFISRAIKDNAKAYEKKMMDAVTRACGLR